MKIKKMISKLFIFSLSIFMLGYSTLNVNAYYEKENNVVESINKLDLTQKEDRIEYVNLKTNLYDEYYKYKMSNDHINATNTLLDIINIHNSLANEPQLVSNMASLNTRASSNIVNVSWQKQLNGYYCGPATASMILKNLGITVAQNNSTLISRLSTTTSGTPWSIGNGTDISHYPMANTLNLYKGVTLFIPRPFVAAQSTLTRSNLKSSTIASIDAGRAFACLGTSKRSSSHSSHLTNYPTNMDVGHWLVISGYGNNGESIYVTDPAAGISGFENVQRNRYETLDKMYSFASYKGIVF